MSKLQEKRKKYVDFVLYLDSKVEEKPTIEKLFPDESKNAQLKTSEKDSTLQDSTLQDSTLQDCINKMPNILAFINKISSTNKSIKTNPNKYIEPAFILLEQENSRHHFARDLFSKKNNIKIPELKIPAPIKKTKKNVQCENEIETIKDLLVLIDANPLDEAIEYNINMEGLHKIRPYLSRLENMVGMKTLKKNIVDQLLYYIQDFHLGGKGTSRGDYLHTVIYGPPGTGKTHIAKIIGKIFSKLGILKKGVFKKVTRSDLVAGYLGQTALKTRDIINECLDGVLFIDEAYALGNSEKRDSFSKECIDTLCEALSNYKENLMVIIAGYESELNECFFSYNKGLDSRFTWRFKIDAYDGKDLHKIFLKKISDYGWNTDDSLKEEWFIKHSPYFTFYGRDMEVLFSKTKIAHSRRVFCKTEEEKKNVKMQDIEKAFAMFMENDEVKKRKNDASYKQMLNTIYV
jgi:AAA+ superfamily predicted ATPase